MARYEFRMQRLYVEDDLAPDRPVALGRDPSHYLVNVLRMGVGSEALLFNGRDGEWRAGIETVGKKTVTLSCRAQTRPQPVPTELVYAFAPLKHARLDYVVQKAVEMGASRLAPVITQHTQIARINPERMRANMIEAAEQCGVLAIPALDQERNLGDFLCALDAENFLIFCDEDADVKNPIDALREHCADASVSCAPVLLIGPEGGFSRNERELILQRENCVRISLGPRILRADTAAVAAFAIVQATLGDWR